MDMKKFLGSITGFERLAIKSKFGESVIALLDGDPLDAITALAFIEFKRDGDTDLKAHTKAMSLTMDELTERLKGLQEASEDEALDPSN
ncbi:hypothetical protein OG984_06475 [Nocardioides sp. NBC_00368]|uniref:hypothetical protein n=1 Tax=Nocardioides sp. NBC_00368 TaxID=2976000 RepID=UPI002E241AB0